MGLETKITYLDKVRFHVTARDHEVTSDQPLENGGTDGGMTPPELLLASLGSCAAHYAVEYLRARKMPTDGLTVTVTAAKAQKPARLTNFRIGLSVPGLDDPRHREGILRAAKNCLIHNTLLHAPAIDVDLESNRADVCERHADFAEKLLTEHCWTAPET